MQRISPFLWFDSQAEEAAEFYVSVFENSEIGKVTRYPEEAAKKIGREPGSVMTVRCRTDSELQNIRSHGAPKFSAFLFDRWHRSMWRKADTLKTENAEWRLNRGLRGYR